MCHLRRRVSWIVLPDLSCLRVVIMLSQFNTLSFTGPIPFSEATKKGFGGCALWYVFPQNRMICFAPHLPFPIQNMPGSPQDKANVSTVVDALGCVLPHTKFKNAEFLFTACLLVGLKQPVTTCMIRQWDYAFVTQAALNLIQHTPSGTKRVFPNVPRHAWCHTVQRSTFFQAGGLP